MPTRPSLPARSPTALPRRAAWGVVALLVLTVGSLCLVWYWPQNTMLHFLWAVQAVPLLYVLLAWWGMQAADSEGAEHD